LLDKGVELDERFYDKVPFSEEELRRLLEGVEVTTFLNPRNRLYRERNFKQNPPDREEAIRLILQDPNLLRRPVLVVNGRRIFGFDRDEYARLTQ
jgi:arsenate reductase-like glutaredoxin family protein